MPAKKQAPRKKIHIHVLKQMLTLAASGFGLVAALAWNSLIQEFVTTKIKPFLPNDSGLISLALYAVIITIIAVVITYQLTMLIERLER